MNKILKILVTGANGQLGQELRLKSKKSKNNFFFTDVDDLNILNSEELEQKVIEYSPDVIVNCAAYTAVDTAETQQEEASALNYQAVRNIAIIAARKNIKIVHISTDYVFDGCSYVPYNEEHNPNPLSVYGYTKLQGERALIESGCDGVIIRTSWLYSNFGKNFYKSIERISKTQNEINVVFDQVGTPTYAGDLADAIVYIIPQLDTIFGIEIYHYSNEGACSWYDFANAVVKTLGLTTKIYPIHTDEYPTDAQRPFYSILDKSKIKNAFGIEINHWQESLINCVRERNS